MQLAHWRGSREFAHLRHRAGGVVHTTHRHLLHELGVDTILRASLREANELYAGGNDLEHPYLPPRRYRASIAVLRGCGHHSPSCV